MSESDPLVSLRHMRMAGVCANGGREWFRRYGLSWETFVREGLPASTIEATGDGIALRVTAEARREAAEGVAVAEVTSEPEPAAVKPAAPVLSDMAEQVRRVAELTTATAEEPNRGG